MGGRGASSSKTSGGGLSGAIKNANPLRVEGKVAQGKEKEATEVINGATKVLEDFGVDKGINILTFSDDKEKGVASMNGFGDLTISNSYLSNPTKAKEGTFTSDTLAGTGAHEAGHRVAQHLLRKSMQGKTELEISKARNSGKIEKQIIKEATKRFGSNPSISKYGEESVKEKVAEAISDVYTNGNKAHPYSKEIVTVMKDINNGKLKVKI